MTPLNDGHNFDIAVQCEDGQTRVYRTLNCISDSGAKELHSRGTRVWRAVLVEGGEMRGEPVAMKDVWIQSTGKPEGVTLQAVCAATEIEDDCIKDAFPTVRSHGYVFLDDERRVLDCTLQLTSEDSASQTSVNAGDPARQFPKQMTHYRIVFAEVCRSLHHERSLPTIFKGLARIAKGTLLVQWCCPSWLYSLSPLLSVADVAQSGMGAPRCQHREHPTGLRWQCTISRF